MVDGSGATPVTRRLRDATVTGAAASRRVAAQVIDAIQAVPPPVLPLRENWHVGLGHLIRGLPQVSEPLSRLVSPLDRLAEVSVGPDHLSFDGQVVPWKDVTEIRLGSVTEVLSTAALDKELARLVSKLPPVPGRKWASRQVTEFALGMVVAVAERVLGDHPEDPAARSGEPALIPLGVSCRSRLGRRRELTPGLVAALLCTAVPGVTAAISDTARERGASISVPPPAGASRRAAQIRTAAEALKPAIEARLTRSKETGGDENAAQ